MHDYIIQNRIFAITGLGNLIMKDSFYNKSGSTGKVCFKEAASGLDGNDSIIFWMIDWTSSKAGSALKKEFLRLQGAYHVIVMQAISPHLMEQAFETGAHDISSIELWNETMFKKTLVQANIFLSLKKQNKNLEHLLYENQQNYSMLIDQLAEGIAMYNNEGKIIEVNKSFEKMLGYTTEELKRLNITDILAPLELKQIIIKKEVLKNERITVKQRTMVRKNGEVIETEVYTSNLRGGLFFTSVRNFTERLQIQENLRKEKIISDSIINSMPGLFYMFNQKGQYLRWNRQLELISGYSSEEILGMNPADFFLPAEHEVLKKEIDNVFFHGQSALEANLLTKYGSSIPYYFTGVSVTIDGESCLLGTAIDLSPLRNLERKLANQKIAEQKRMMQVMIEAEESEKNKLALELHDNINQMLSVVRLYLSMIQHEKEKSLVNIPDAMKILGDAIEEIRALSHNLAIANRFEAGLVNLLHDLVEKIKTANKLQVTLGLPPVLDERTDYGQKLAIYRIVQEQLNNIIKHAQATSVEIIVIFTELHITLSINDNGLGFDPSTQKQGIGLMNIRNRAEALLGNFEISSAPQKGTSLVIRLPINPTV